MAKRIAIIGSGCSGLTAVKCCLDEQLEPVCFERRNDIGGLWNFHMSTVDDQSCVMKTTVINTSKEMMCFSDFPIPADFPNFMHNTKVLEYFRLYASNFNLLPHIRFEHEILSVVKKPDFQKTGQWLVTVRDLKTDQVTHEVFDAVMLCTGHHASKHEPKFPNQEQFKGKIVHTHDYRSSDGFEDKDVVVVGIGNSGGDISVDLSKIAKQVYLSTRRGAWIVNRIGSNGIPGDVEFSRRINVAVNDLLGRNIADHLLKSALNNRFDHEVYGLKPSHRPTAQHPTVNDELPNRIASGAIVVKPNIRYFHENAVEFTDGSVVDADIVVLATGYVFGFPYLDKDVLEVKNNVTNLYKYVFPPDVTPNTLAVIGCLQPIGAIMPMSELQCRWATRVFKGLIELPPSDEMWTDIYGKHRTLQQRYVAAQRHTMQVDWLPFMDELAQQIDAKPQLGELLLRDPSLAYRCFFGPCTPYQFRLFGPGKWPGARQAIMTQEERIYKGFCPNVKPPAANFTFLYVLLSVLVVFLTWLLVL